MRCGRVAGGLRAPAGDWYGAAVDVVSPSARRRPKWRWGESSANSSLPVIPYSTGKEQGISPISGIARASSAEIPVQIQSVGKAFPTDWNREYFRANRELQEGNRESILPAPHSRTSSMNFVEVPKMSRGGDTAGRPREDSAETPAGRILKTRARILVFRAKTVAVFMPRSEGVPSRCEHVGCDILSEPCRTSRSCGWRVRSRLRRSVPRRGSRPASY